MAVAIALSLAVTAACTGETGPEKPPKAVRTTPQPVPAARLAAVTLPGEPAALVEVITRQVRASGSVRAEHATTSAEGNKRIEEKITAQLRTGLTPPSAQLTIVDRDPADPSTTEAVLLNGVIYTRVDGEEQAPGKPWVQLTRQDAKNPELAPFAKLLTGLIDQVENALSQMSTDTGLALVRNGTFKGEPAKETLDGVQVQRYSGATPANKLAGKDPAFAALSKTGLKEVGWVLWVDDKGLPRKFQVDHVTPDELRGSQTITYARWGEPVLIEAPPANQIHKVGA
ncbi:hypothetical protein [Actinomadura sp. 9N407]|uniref:hypothetical protein n=1 Tax=Actinomadura sp. 9N407 TaxID=3375154 RepID=UPI0037926BEB